MYGKVSQKEKEKYELLKTKLDSLIDNQTDISSIDEIDSDILEIDIKEDKYFIMPIQGVGFEFRESESDVVVVFEIVKFENRVLIPLEYRLKYHIEEDPVMKVVYDKDEAYDVMYDILDI